MFLIAIAYQHCRCQILLIACSVFPLRIEDCPMVCHSCLRRLNDHHPFSTAPYSETEDPVWNTHRQTEKIDFRTSVNWLMENAHNSTCNNRVWELITYLGYTHFSVSEWALHCIHTGSVYNNYEFACTRRLHKICHTYILVWCMWGTYWFTDVSSKMGSNSISVVLACHACAGMNS